MMRAIGIDISKYQPSYDASKKKHDFVIIKSSEYLWEDTAFQKHAGEISDVPVRGAYHYFRSKDIEDKNFWRKQADFFLNLVIPYKFEILALDFEKTGNKPSSRFGSGALLFLDYVSAETEARVILYTNPSIYQGWLTQYGQRWMNHYPLWVAQYPYYGWNDHLSNVYSGEWQPRLPAGHKDWMFWQFSADGNKKGPENGIKRQPWHVGNPAVDLNVFNGTATQLLKWAKKTENPPTPQPGVDRNNVLDEVIQNVKAMKQ